MKNQGQSLFFNSQPQITSTANIVGPFEGIGQLTGYFDYIMKDSLEGHTSWEKCESYMLEWSIRKAIDKASYQLSDIDFVMAGDLLNQLTSTHFAVRNLNIPFLGLYGACSTLVEGMLLASALIDGRFASNMIAAVSSHHDTAERQYRFPTEQGVQRPPISQWTVTGAGALLISANNSNSSKPKVVAGTVGKIVDMGIKDTNAMGPAMAPAAADTLIAHFSNLNIQPRYYDMIYTGDLGKVGKLLLIELLKESGYNLSTNYEDCGCMIYTNDQDTHSGASGCASSAVVFSGYIYQQLMQKNLRRVLLVGTGSLHSPTSYQQKESIPSIAHAVAIEA